MARTKSEPKLKMTCHADDGCGKDIEVPISETVRMDEDAFRDDLIGMDGENRIQILVDECPSCHKPTVSTYMGWAAVIVDAQIAAASATVEDIVGSGPGQV